MLPRLWPYLDHNTSSVRKATLQTLRTLTRPLVTHRTNGETTSDDKSQSTDTNGENGDQKDDIKDKKDSLKDQIIDSKDQKEIPKDQDMSNDQKEASQSVVSNSNGEEMEVIANGDDKSDVKVNGDAKVSDDSDKLMWTPELLQEAMRYIYQRVLFEHVHEIQDIAVQVTIYSYTKGSCVILARIIIVKAAYSTSVCIRARLTQRFIRDSFVKCPTQNSHKTAGPWQLRINKTDADLNITVTFALLFTEFKNLALEWNR